MTVLGRPSKFEPEMCEQAHSCCLLGATNDELAEFLGVSPSTIDRWIAGHRDFGDAVKRGRVAADARVARGLYARAVGYERKTEREVIVGGELKHVTSTVHYPPNVQACIFWLRNRRRRTWRDGPADPSNTIDDIALLDAAGESVRHHDGG
jgi:transcriptional regulator with XRE-family HTH domain